MNIVYLCTMLTKTEENYLKAIFHLTMDREGATETGTNDLAAYLDLKPPTVNNMLKKLKEKNLISYEKYGKTSLTPEGKSNAIEIVRKHRLWETFLYEKLNFSWDEVHEVAEQLEHIQSVKLIEQIEKMLGYPEVDPHGDPIPTADGEIKFVKRKTLSEVAENTLCKLVAVNDNSTSFLQHVFELGIGLNCKIKVLKRHNFDGSMEIEIDGKIATVSRIFGDNLYVI